MLSRNEHTVKIGADEVMKLEPAWAHRADAGLGVLMGLKIANDCNDVCFHDHKRSVW